MRIISLATYYCNIISIDINILVPLLQMIVHKIGFECEFYVMHGSYEKNVIQCHMSIGYFWFECVRATLDDNYHNKVVNFSC